MIHLISDFKTREPFLNFHLWAFESKNYLYAGNYYIPQASYTDWPGQGLQLCGKSHLNKVYIGE